MHRASRQKQHPENLVPTRSPRASPPSLEEAAPFGDGGVNYRTAGRGAPPRPQASPAILAPMLHVRRAGRERPLNA